MITEPLAIVILMRKGKQGLVEKGTMITLHGV